MSKSGWGTILVLLGLLLLAPLVAGGFSRGSGYPSSGPASHVTVRVDAANVRAWPSEQAPVVAHVSRGQRLEVVREVNGWVQVTGRGVRGYVYASLVRRD